ncbi:MAG: hypothetical protein ACLR8Y_17535 [Alistipes indistinctus]
MKIRDLQNQPIDLPYLGKAPLLLFYVDPDHAGQNSDFIAYLEEHQIGGDKIQAYGIVNLKDAPLLPNGVVRSMMRSKQKKTGAAMYTDVDCSAARCVGVWAMSTTCFVIIFVNKDRKVEFFRYGDFTEKTRRTFGRSSTNTNNVGIIRQRPVKAVAVPGKSTDFSGNGLCLFRYLRMFCLRGSLF